jgi:3',5'-cyclic AMP phosphodiesterase CpdA
MSIRTLAHISDLHLGRDTGTNLAAAHMRDRILSLGIDHVIVTGDVTHRGRAEEWALFEAIFLPLGERVSVVPGNHDRLGDEVARRIMPSDPVDVIAREGLHLVRVDSTGQHNRFLLAGHGDLCQRKIDRIGDALDWTLPDALVVVALHHHPMPMPVETFGEQIATRLGLPFAQELQLGQQLLRSLIGRCDLLLHGHRHKPRALEVAITGERPLGIYNAGCSTTLGRFRLFRHNRGTLVEPPFWIETTHAAEQWIEEAAS